MINISDLVKFVVDRYDRTKDPAVSPGRVITKSGERTGPDADTVCFAPGRAAPEMGWPPVKARLFPVSACDEEGYPIP